jgi:zinc transport system substrate-binding protein
VVNLTKPGGEPHDLEIPPKETAQIVDADLVLYESGFQPAVDDAISQNSGGTTLDASDVVDLVAPDHDGHDHGAADHGSTDHADHTDLDPHFWQDPDRMAALGQAVAKKLAGVDPTHAAEYAANARRLSSDLTALGSAYARGLATCQRDTVVVSHDAFGYLSKYGLVMEPIAGLSPGAEPTPADLARLEDLIRSDGITTVFSERLVSPRLSASLANDVGVRTAVLDPIEGLSDQTTDDDYLSLMRQNLTGLRKANGCS